MSFQKSLLLVDLNELQIHLGSFTREVARDIAAGSAPIEVIGRCVRDANRSTQTHERIRRGLKQSWKENGPKDVVEGLMPTQLLPALQDQLVGRHTAYPEPVNRPGSTEDLDVEWAIHVASLTLLYRISMDIGTTSSSKTMLGHRPENRQAAKLWEHILRAVDGDAPDRPPLGAHFLNVFTSVNSERAQAVSAVSVEDVAALWTAEALAPAAREL